MVAERCGEGGVEAERHREIPPTHTRAHLVDERDEAPRAVARLQAHRRHAAHEHGVVVGPQREVVGGAQGAPAELVEIKLRVFFLGGGEGGRVLTQWARAYGYVCVCVRAAVAGGRARRVRQGIGSRTPHAGEYGEAGEASSSPTPRRRPRAAPRAAAQTAPAPTPRRRRCQRRRHRRRRAPRGVRGRRLRRRRAARNTAALLQARRHCRRRRRHHHSHQHQPLHQARAERLPAPAAAPAALQ